MDALTAAERAAEMEPFEGAFRRHAFRAVDAAPVFHELAEGEHARRIAARVGQRRGERRGQEFLLSRAAMRTHLHAKPMNKGPLTADEVRHLDHRWNVLQAFPEVIQYKNAVGHSREGRIYRGCLDGAIATCRALSERFGITLHTREWKSLLPCTAEFKTKIRTIHSAATDRECESLWKVLTAANRCVCHLEHKLIDHEVGDVVLNQAASLIKTIIKAQLAAANLTSAVCI